MEGFLKIGLIVKPQGVRGQVKVNPLTDDLLRFKNLKEAYINGEKVKVGGVKIADGYVILSLFGVSDRNAAELLRGKFLEVKREDAVPLPENTFFITDVIGCVIFTEDGTKVGVVTEVTSAKTDVFTVLTDDGKIMRFPFLKKLLIKVDVGNKKITVKDKELSEVSCYED